MALLQEIAVPLLAVNDTSLTVVEMNFVNGQFVKKGDHIMVFETSKTTYDVQAEADGYVQYLCELDKDYEVNEIVAKIFSEENEVEKIKTIPVINSTVTKQETVFQESAPVWEGETLYSSEAVRLIESSGIDKSIFNKKDFVSRNDVADFLGIAKKEPQKVTVQKNQTETKKKNVLPVDAAKTIIEKLSSNKKREI